MKRITEDQKDLLLDYLTDLMQAVYEDRVEWSYTGVQGVEYLKASRQSLADWGLSDRHFYTIHMIITDGVDSMGQT